MGTKRSDQTFSVTGCLPRFRVRCEMAASALAPGWGRFVWMCTIGLDAARHHGFAEHHLVGRRKNDRRNRVSAAVQAREETRKAGSKTWKHIAGHRLCPDQGTATDIAAPSAMRWSGTGSKSAGCSFTCAFARRNDVGGCIMIDNIRGGALANDVRGEQTLDIGKAGQVAQKIAPSPGSAVSSVTSAHDVTRQGSRPNPRQLF